MESAWEGQTISISSKKKVFLWGFDYLQNVSTVGSYYIKKYGVDPPMINGEQMPLHRNESAQEKYIWLKCEDTSIKENHKFSRECVIVFLQDASISDVNLKLEFAFKGKGLWGKVLAVDNINYQYSPSGSYWLEHMLE